jgi:hypothetical protein
VNIQENDHLKAIDGMYQAGAKVVLTEEILYFL